MKHPSSTDNWVGTKRRRCATVRRELTPPEGTEGVGMSETTFDQVRPGATSSRDGPDDVASAESPARSDPAVADPHRDRTTLALVGVAAITVFGAYLRANGFSELGLYRDDAWVALSARVGLNEAWHMGVTAPGFVLFERAFTMLGPGSTTWMQIPIFVTGVVAIPAMYALSRYFGLGRVAGLVAAGVVSLSPICVIYATRIKEYEADFLLTCVVLALGETARRAPGRRSMGFLAIGSVAAFACSASVAPVLVGVWLALLLSVLRSPKRPWTRSVIGAGAAATLGCGLVALAFYAHPSPAIQRFWASSFLHGGSPGSIVSSLVSTSWDLVSPVVGLSSIDQTLRVGVVLACILLAILGVRRNASMVGPAAAVATAYVASALHVEPLGTGRTDLYLYPALLLLLAAGGTEVARMVTARPATALPVSGRVAQVGLASFAVLIVIAAIGQAYEDRPVYPGVAVTTLAAEISRHEQPGDRIFVSELMRYPWAFYEQPTLALRFGSDWSTGFTVTSTEPSVFIAPSEYYEGGSHPREWAQQMAGARRIWYVWSPPLGVFSPSYAALRAEGWQPEARLEAQGCAATLLVRD